MTKFVQKETRLATYNSLNDMELIALLKNGDREAYTQIYDRYIFVLLNHAYRMTRNREEAKDVVHEVFSALWERRLGLWEESNLSAFLYTSTRNLVLNQIAHQGVKNKYAASMLHFAAQEEAPTDYRIRERQLAELIEREIAQLPPKMQQVFNLSRKEGRSHKEIAEYLQLSEQTVSKHISNALKILKGKLGVLVYLWWLCNS